MLPLVAAVLLSATAAPSRPTALSWQAPAECPAQDAFVAALAFRTSRVVIVNEDQQPTGWLVATITRQKKKLMGRLQVRLPTGATTREVTGKKCETVVEALSLVAALLLDPENAKLGALPAKLPPVEKVAPVLIEPAPVTVVEPVPAPVVAVEVPVPPPTIVTAPELPTQRPPTTQWRLSVGPHMTTAVSGDPLFGGTLGLSWEQGLAVVRLTLGAGSGATVVGPLRTARYPLHLMGTLEVAAMLNRGAFRFEFGGSASTLAFSVASTDSAMPVEVWRALVAVGPMVRALLSIDQLHVGLSVSGGVNVRRDTYVVDPSGTVFTTPLLFLQPGLMVSHAL